jgi:general secretion pathway protein C
MKYRWLYTFLVAAVALSFWVPTIRDARKDGAESLSAPPPARPSSGGNLISRPLEDYGIVSERGLFGGSGQESSAAVAQIAPDTLPTAGQGLGLRLVGTVVADEPGVSFAIIESQAGKRQEFYREGERAGQALIKKIARNQVVVNAGSGDRVLAMDLEDRGRLATANAAEPAPKQVSSFRAEFADLIQQIHVRPYLETGRPGGILVYGIEPGSVFAAMGLEDGDVIRGLNGEAISSPQQTVDLYRAMREGGALTLQVKRGDGNQELRFDGREAPPHPKEGGPTDRS